MCCKLMPPVLNQFSKGFHTTTSFSRTGELYFKYLCYYPKYISPALAGSMRMRQRDSRSTIAGIQGALRVCNNIVFRPAVEGESAPIVSLLRSANLPCEDLAGTAQVRFIVAVRGAQLIGCIGIEMTGCHALLRSFAILETERRAGTGGQLLNRAEVTCRQHGAVATYLLTLTAEQFFAKRGYARVSRDDAPPGIRSTSEFASICPTSSALMMKLL